MRRLIVIGSTVTACVGLLAAQGSSSPVQPCTGSQLNGVFAHVPGSEGAGNTVYKVRVRNRSKQTCFVSGIPLLQLLDKTGHKLPTHAVAESPGTLTAAKIDLAPGKYANATARFSPDVPGTGEPTNKACEPTASRIRITPQPGGGTVEGPIAPPTAVCEHGGMSLRAFRAGR
jgi:hypothetical protein